MQAAASKASDADKAKNKAAIESTDKKAFVDRCNTNITASQVTCALKTTSMDQLDACDKG